MTTKNTRAAIVWNPSKTAKEDLESALLEASRRGVEVDPLWFETSEIDPGNEATQRALDADVEVVIAAGGDGTVRAVAELLADTGAEVDLGIIPLGTGNLLARNLDVPLNDLPAAFTRALTANGKPLDVGWARLGRPARAERFAFTVMAGFGIDAHMITETDEELKSRAGWLAYVESLGRAIAASEVISLKISVDGEPAELDQAHTLIVGNCGALQGGISLLPDADPYDGKLDLLVLRADGIAGWADTMRNMIWDNGLKRFFASKADGDLAQGSEAVAHIQMKSLTIELDEPRVFEVDGDDLSKTTLIEITVQPAAITVR